jgi:ribonucleoside-diphosphate reductase alpha chain
MFEINTGGERSPSLERTESISRANFDFNGIFEDFEKGKETLNISANSRTVLERRYLQKAKDGSLVETPEELFRRVARNIASAEPLVKGGRDPLVVEEEFYSLLTSFEFMPNSPTLMNAERELQQLSACFVLPVEDSIDSIFKAVRDTALIHKSGGGTGFTFSRIRPRNAIVSTSHGYASGPISFLKVFNEATEAINQGGFRRGANMGILRVDHPDILDFIQLKAEDRRISNFNISVGITEEFMKALAGEREYELVNPHDGKVAGKLRAGEVFDLIVNLAWKNGEPGIVFLDKINAVNPTPQLGEIESTNPCGEQPLLPYEACNLGSIHLGKMVSGGKINYEKLKRVVRSSVHFLDNVIEVNRYPMPEIDQMCRANRKIGLGVMGFADMLIQMGIPYNSEAAVDTARNVMRFIQEESHAASADLADQRGEFPNFKGSIFDSPAGNGARGGRKMRNATVTTIAPTGTISIISDASSGVEPIFALCYIRNVMDNTHLVEVNPLFKQIAERYEFYSDELMDTVARQGSVHGIDDVPEQIQRVFVTAHDVDPEWHIRIQAAFQEFTDNAVSKTVNFGSDATVEDIRSVYLKAYELNCKGVTVYRDGSRDNQVLNIGEVNDGKSGGGDTGTDALRAAAGFSLSQPRPAVIHGHTVRMKTGCGNLYVTINEDADGQPFELFNHIGKAGGCAASQSEAIGRLISLTLRSGLSVEPIVQQLKGISCHSHVWGDEGKVLSCADAIGKALERYLKISGKGKEGSRSDAGSPDLYDSRGGIRTTGVVVRGACADCGGILEHEEGCVVCRTCGYSECG